MSNGVGVVDQVLVPTQKEIDDMSLSTLTATSFPLLPSSLPAKTVKRSFKSICQRVRKCNEANLQPTIELAADIAGDGREGRRIGTLVVFGDADAVMARSRPLILDPLAGHSNHAKHITDRNLRGTIKELAQLDGAFVISNDGTVVAACRYLDAVASDVVLPYEIGEPASSWRVDFAAH